MTDFWIALTWANATRPNTGEGCISRGSVSTEGAFGRAALYSGPVKLWEIRESVNLAVEGREILQLDGQSIREC